MLVRSFLLGSYSVVLYRQRLPPIAQRDASPPYVAYIECFSAEGGKNGDRVCIFFVPPGVDPPSSTTQPPKPGESQISGLIWAPFEEFGWYLDVLRNERKVFADLVLADTATGIPGSPTTVRSGGTAIPAAVAGTKAAPQNSLRTELTRAGWGNVDVP